MNQSAATARLIAIQSVLRPVSVLYVEIVFPAEAGPDCEAYVGLWALFSLS